MSVIRFIDHWQTLTSGILAIIAAGVGTYFLRRQIHQADRQERDRLRRRLSAVRATLPLTLNGLSAYAEAAFVQLLRVRSEVGEHHSGCLPDTFAPPEKPTNHVTELRDVIEATDDQKTVNLIGEICSEIQILDARMSSLRDRDRMRSMVGVTMMIDENLIQAARLSALVGGLFEFARRETNNVPGAIPWSSAMTLFSIHRVDGKAFPGLFSAIEHRQQRLPQAWTANSAHA